MTRSLKVYQGEDSTPVFDYTDDVIWERVEAGHRAYKGEAISSQFPMRDERGQTGSSISLPAGLTQRGLPAGARLEWLEGSTRMFYGRIGPKDYSRGAQKADRAREVVVNAHDINHDLRNIIVDGWARPQETDVARATALVADYLTGNPRVTTVIDTAFVSGSNTVTLPARVYDATDPGEILADIATVANKLHFVTIDGELFYDGWDSVAYQAGIRISDRLDEINYSGVCGGEEGSTLYDLDFADLDLAGNFDPVPVYPSGTGSWPNDPLNWSSTNPAGHNGGKCVVWGGLFVDQGSDSPFIPVTPGVTYAWHLWAYTQEPSAANNDLLDVVFYSSLGVILQATVLTPNVPLNTWTEYSGNATAPAGAAYMVLSTAEGWGPNAYSNAYDDVTVSAVGGGSEVLALPPIWDVGPSSTEDGTQLLSGLRLYYGQGSNTYVYVDDPATANAYWHSEQSLYTDDPAVNTSGRATTLAAAILQRRKYEDRTYNVSIGPLNDTQVGCIKPGQLLAIKARAIPDADDAFVTRRIAQLKWSTPVPGMFFAHMQLDRPIKESPYGVGPKTATDSINRHVGQGSNSHPEYVLRGILTTQGDLPFRGASDWTRRAIGASNTILASDGSSPVWAHRTVATGSALTVEDEGTPLATAATTLDFVGAGVTASGTGAEKTITIPGGSGGLTQAFVGYNTVGGSTEVMIATRVYAKKVTLANDCLVTDIEAHVDAGNTNDSVRDLWAALFSDNAGTPEYLLQAVITPTNSLLLDTTSGAGGNTNLRWYGMPIGRWLVAGDYWIAVRTSASDTIRIRYDGSGSDRYYTVSGAWFADWGFYSPTTTTNTYSIRANTIR